LKERRAAGCIHVEGGRGQLAPCAAVIVGAMQLGSEMAVLERGIERSVAHVMQRRGDRHAGKIRAGEFPTRA
jgi:hypothetical protein